MNKLITICGIDKLGKTTQAMALAKRLKAKYIKFPSDTTLPGKIIRAILNNKEIKLEIDNQEFSFKEEFNPKYFQALNLADKLLAENKIKEYLKESHVICDRYDIDSIAYSLGDIDSSWCFNASNLLTVRSDIVIYFKGEQFKREGEDLYEGDKSRLERIESYFDFITRTSNVPHIIVNNTPDSSVEMITNNIMRYLESEL